MRVALFANRSRLVAGIVAAFALAGITDNVYPQTPATGAVWVDTNGAVVGPALGNNMILLKIPSVGEIVLSVGIGPDNIVLSTVTGDPIRWKYSFILGGLVPAPTVARRFESSDCTGQGYADVLGLQTVGNTVQATQLDDSVNHWLIIGSFPVTSPVPQFHSQTVQNLQGAGSFCQTVNVKQGGSVVPITHFIDQATLASPAMVLQ